MKKSLANSRDFNAGRRQSISWKKIAYKIGSALKGCHSCGEWEMRQYGRRSLKYYFSGHDVWRSYCPSQTGWTYYCYTCSAKDHKAWENAKDVGEEALRGSREALAALRKMRKVSGSKTTSRPQNKPLSKEMLDRLAESVEHIFKR